MRTVIVGVLAFIVLVALFWAMDGFISTVWNPMTWNGFGRALLVLASVGIALPLSGLAAAGYYEEVEKPRQKQQR